MLSRSPDAVATGDYGGVIGDTGKKGSAVCRSVAVGEERAARERWRSVRFRAGSTSLLKRSRDGISITRMRWSITPIGFIEQRRGPGAIATGSENGRRERTFPPLTSSRSHTHRRRDTSD